HADPDHHVGCCAVRHVAAHYEPTRVALADELFLDNEQLTEELHSEEVAETTAANASQCWDLGIMSTPAFVVGCTPMVGAQPTDVFTTAIDDALAESGS